MGKITQHQVRDDYEAFWNRFKKYCLGNGLSLHPRSEYPFEITDKNAALIEVKITSPIYLEQWKEFGDRDVSPKIDILIHGSEVIDVQTKMIVYSEVHVEYYEVPSKTPITALPRELVRYDFKAPPREAHPIFHAQLTACPCKGDNAIWKANTAIKWGEIDRTEGWKRLGSLKIPTPHMSLVSVLVCLCADHSPNTPFGAFLQNLIDDRHGIPKADTKALKTHPFAPSASWESVIWYPLNDGKPKHSRKGHKGSLLKTA